jgi:hypothetical protein
MGATKCSDHNMHNQPHPTYIKEGRSDNTENEWGGTYLEKITLDFKERKGTCDAYSIIRKKFSHR